MYISQIPGLLRKGEDPLIIQTLTVKAVLFLWRVIALTPTFILYFLADIITWLLYHARFMHMHKLLDEQLLKCLPELSDKEHRRIKKRHLRLWGEYMVDYIKMVTITPKKIKEKIKYNNIELLQSLLEEKQYVCCYCAHMMGFEFFVGLPLWLDGYGMSCFYLSSTYEPQHPVDKWIRDWRAQFGARPISTTGSLRGILNFKHEVENGTSPYKGFVVGSLGEMEPQGNGSQATMRFFGHKTEILVGTETIARKLNAAFVYAHIKHTKRGHYEVDFVELKPQFANEDPISYTREFVIEMERNIKAQPEMWLYWCQKRV